MTRILQISDPHIGVPGRLLGGMIDTAAALSRTVEWIARNLRAIGPIDAVIVTGDLVESGRPEEYAHFLRLIAPLPLPWFAIPGNHDNREVMREAFSHLHWMPDHGAINLHLQFDRLDVVALDSHVPGAGHGILGNGTLGFLDRALDTAGRRPVLVAVHHHPFRSGIKAMDALALLSPEPLLARLAGHRAGAQLVCGHLHRAVTTVAAGVLCLSCPSPSHAVALRLQPEQPLALMLEPGAIMLHCAEDGAIRSHLVPTAPAPGPIEAEA
ncbi:phosphodiesterase [Paracoccus sp. (in: a-proteobacteria)]